MQDKSPESSSSKPNPNPCPDGNKPDIWSEMNLKKPLWASGLKMETSSDSTEAQVSAATAVEELVNSLNDERLYREITLALRTSLRDARAEFSFLRTRALRSLLKFLRSVAKSDSTISFFCQTQSIPDLQGES